MDARDAVRVGIVLNGRQHALSSEECQDRAAPESTRLLEEDRALSDLAGSETARLCSHHSQLYMLSCQGRKCSVVSCYSSVKGAHRGAPFCKRHLAETVRSPSPARKPKSTDTALASALRLQSQQSGAEEAVSIPEDDVPIKQVAFADKGRSPVCDPPVSSPRTPAPRRRPSTPPPRSACLEPDTLREGEGFATGTLTRPFFGKIKDRMWYIYLGRSQGISPDSRRNERVKIHLPSLGLDVSVPWVCVGPAPSTRQHRLPAAWLAQYLYTTPHDLEERGVTIQVVRLPEEMLEWLQGWDGVAVRPSSQEMQHLKGEDLRSLIVRPTITLLGHEEGRLLSVVEPDEFKTPPRPQLGSAAEEIVKLFSEDEQIESLPPADELYSMYERERLRTQDSASAVALLAGAYGCSPDQVRSKVLSGLDFLLSSWVGRSETPG